MCQWVRILTLLMLIGSAQAEVVVRIVPSAMEMRTSEQLTLRLEVDAPADQRVELPDAYADFGTFSLVDLTPPQRRRTAAGVRHTRSYVLEPFLAGDYTIPPLPVQTKDRLGRMTNQTATALTIPVRSVIAGDPADAEMMALADDLPAARGGWLSKVIAAILALLATKLFRRRKKPVATEAQTPEQQLLEMLSTMPSQLTPGMLAECLKPTWRDPELAPEWQRLEACLFSKREPQQAELQELVEAFRSKLGEAA